ncbi:glycoside hydrolase family 115 protein [Moniliophthora roreri]|nr:glycoside hydrolase family 115 protein [Moniliophthora roreri]
MNGTGSRYLNFPLNHLFYAEVHYEPMMRGTPNEWNIYGSGTWDYTMNKDIIHKYWVDGTKRAKPCESIFIVGCSLIRQGEYPSIGRVINNQRQILKDVFNETDIANVPHYNEVIGYYTKGLKISDHVTLLLLATLPVLMVDLDRRPKILQVDRHVRKNVSRGRL